LQPLRLRQQQRGPLVRGEAPGEADGEHLGSSTSSVHATSLTDEALASFACAAVPDDAHEPLASLLLARHSSSSRMSRTRCQSSGAASSQSGST
jgi:hypothetical protein